MIERAFLEILRCPETGKHVSEAPAEMIGRLEAERLAGRLRTRAGAAITDPIEAGLVREDGALFYPIRFGIPVMLVEDSVEVPRAGGFG